VKSEGNVTLNLKIAMEPPLMETSEAEKGDATEFLVAASSRQSTVPGLMYNSRRAAKTGTE